MNPPLLEVCELTCSYPGRAQALKPVSLAIRAGERIAVLGGNGAGKSTLFLALNGVLRPDSGRIFLKGEEVQQNKAGLQRLRTAVGMVFQEPDTQLIAPTVEVDVAFGPMNLNLPPAEVAARVNESLAALELEAFRTRSTHMLSGGEKKRVTIADVLAMRPSLMLLDEPTASLDAAGVAALEEILARLHGGGMTLLISTHDMDLAWRWADRILLFHNGELLADAAPEAIFSDSALISHTGINLPHVFRITETLARQGLISALPQDKLPRSLPELGALLTAG